MHLFVILVAVVAVVVVILGLDVVVVGSVLVGEAEVAEVPFVPVVVGGLVVLGVVFFKVVEGGFSGVVGVVSATVDVSMVVTTSPAHSTLTSSSTTQPDTPRSYSTDHDWLHWSGHDAVQEKCMTLPQPLIG